MSDDERAGGDVDPVALGHRLAAARRGVGLAQAEAAEAVGVKTRAVWSWEKGEFRPTTALPKLATLYGVSVQFLLYGVEDTGRELANLRHELAHLLLTVERSNEATATSLEALEAIARDLVAEVRRLRGQLEE